MSCTCADGDNCTNATHGMINEACDKYVESLRRKRNPVEDKLWQAFYGKVVPVNQPVIDAWRKYYDDMEDIDRVCSHAPARRGSRSVLPHRGHFRSHHYHKEVKRIKDTLHRELGEEGRSPTSEGYDEKDMALHEHERDLKPCECSICKEWR